MTTIAKPLKRWMRRKSKASRQALHEHTPGWIRRTFGPAAGYADLMLMDHGVFRLVYQNRHRLGDKAWRSAQPAPHDIAQLKRMGIHTVVNLRGASLSSSYWLEQAACRRHGLVMVDCVLRSRAAPSVAELLAVRDVLERVTYPILVHCKSGADRAGLMSVIYMHVVEGQPIEQAVRQLSLRYGHIRQADTGVLDHFFDCYIADNIREPIAFYDWVETVYRPRDVLATFRANGFASRIVSDILRRE